MKQHLVNLLKGLETLEQLNQLQSRISKLPKCELRQSLLESVHELQQTKWSIDALVQPSSSHECEKASPMHPTDLSQNFDLLIKILGWFSSQWESNRFALISKIDSFDTRKSGDEWLKLSKLALFISSIKRTQ